MSKILHRDKASDTDEIDKVDGNVVNKWRWDWMERTVSIDVKKSFPKIKWEGDGGLKICLKDCMRKIDQPGKAVCLVCNKSEVKYGANGVSALNKHVQPRTHVEKEVSKIKNYKLPDSGPAHLITENYGAPPAFHNVPQSSTTEAPQPTVHI